MSTAEDSLLELHQRREQLEQNVAKLRVSLQYWQGMGTGYEELKEEISKLTDHATPLDLEEIVRDLEGALLTGKEIRDLLEDGRGRKRNGPEVLGLLNRRVDYVQRNIGVLEKRVKIAEDELCTLDDLPQHEEQSDGALPLTEITEELDSDGNILSSSISRPQESALQVMEALRKAGVKDLPGPSDNATQQLPSSLDQAKIISEIGSESKASLNDVTALEFTEKRPSLSPRASSLKEDGVRSRKKSVTFSEDTKAGPSDSKRRKKNPIILTNGQVLQKATAGSFTEFEEPTALVDEMPEDAALRRQMIQYGMEEVGAIVAEMDIDDSKSSSSYSDDDDDMDDQSEGSTDDDEDEFGRTTRRILDDKYMSEMLQLERRLNGKVLENIGPAPNCISLDVPLVNGDSHGPESGQPKIEAKPKRGVRFAHELEPPTPKSSAAAEVSWAEDARPISEAVVERVAPAQEQPQNLAGNKTKSRFKSARAEQNSKGQMDPQARASPYGKVVKHPIAGSSFSAPPVPVTNFMSKQFAGPIAYPDENRTRQVPEGPSGKTHSDLVERSPAETKKSVVEPDELDPALMQQQVAVEYYRMRNRMIQREGGFIQEDDEPEQVSLAEAEEALTGERKMSRFKAARLARNGP